MKKLLNNKKGFTLVELIVVIVILGILAAILAPSLLKWIDKSRQTQSQSNAYTIFTTVQQMVATEYAKADADWSTFISDFANNLTEECGLDVGSDGGTAVAYVDCIVARTSTTSSSGINVSPVKFHYYDINSQTLFCYDFKSMAWVTLISDTSDQTINEAASESDTDITGQTVSFAALTESSIALPGIASTN